MKQFNGKAIYNPSGKAGEYAEWACNFYVGCSNGCEYCYCKKGILKAVMGQDKPQLKKCFKSENHALEVFESEVSFNIVELQKHGVFSNEYYKKVNSLILSARIKNKPVETIEVSLKNMSIVQSRGLRNKATEYHDRIINLVQSNINLIHKAV